MRVYDRPLTIEQNLTMLAATPAAPSTSALERMEHLAMLKHWYYRSSRQGEIFLADARGELPLRRLVRGVSRVFRGEKAADSPAESAKTIEDRPPSSA